MITPRLLPAVRASLYALHRIDGLSCRDLVHQILEHVLRGAPEKDP
jgi:hypothetical protein